jgi:hypothetical protein
MYHEDSFLKNCMEDENTAIIMCKSNKQCRGKFQKNSKYNFYDANK